MWIFSIGICKCQILRKNQTGAGVLDNNTTHTNTNTDTYFKKVYTYFVFLYNIHDALLLGSKTLVSFRDETEEDSEIFWLLFCLRRAAEISPKFGILLAPIFCWLKWGKKETEKQMWGMRRWCWSFVFGLNPVFAPSRVKVFLCVWSLELPHCGCGLGDWLQNFASSSSSSSSSSWWFRSSLWVLFFVLFFSPIFLWRSSCSLIPRFSCWCNNKQQ